MFIDSMRNWSKNQWILGKGLGKNLLVIWDNKEHDEYYKKVKRKKYKSSLEKILHLLLNYLAKDSGWGELHACVWIVKFLKFEMKYYTFGKPKYVHIKTFMIGKRFELSGFFLFAIFLTSEI